MPTVNFSLLNQDTLAAVHALCCKLAEQQAKLGQRVFIVADSTETAKDLDQLLWSYPPDSFVPHALVTDAAAKQTAVVIGTAIQMEPTTTCVLNLGEDPIAAHDALSAIAEFIVNDEDAKAQSRVRWNHYKQAGYELQLHQL